ncbi:MAG: alanine racemase [Coprococcus sp.]
MNNITWKGRTAAIIDLAKLTSNIENIRKRLKPGVELIAVMKGDGYRHGIAGLYPTLKKCGITSYAVAIWEEGKMLRDAGCEEPILILGDTREDVLDEALKYNLDLTVFSLSGAQNIADAARRAGKTQNIQIKINTGMNRIGFPVNDESVKEIKEISKLNELNLTGIFTHFARADEADHKSADKQLELYLNMVERLKQEGVTFPKHHVSNSPAILMMPHAQLDAVRCGDIMYGLTPSDEYDWKNSGLQEILSWYTYVAMVKEVPAGSEIGYGGTFVTKRPTKIATLPIGFADGYSRYLSNKGKVIIRGKEAPIVGRICMDQCMADVTDIPDVERNDTVTLLGDGVSIEWMADLLETNVDVIVCNISARVPRVYVN